MGKIEEISRRMERLQEKLEAIEEAIPLASELMELSKRMNLPINLYSGQLKQLIILNSLKDSLPGIEKDDISKGIIHALVESREMNISQISRKVRSLRGKASRRIISERLETLEDAGIVERFSGPNNEKKFRLRSGKK